MKINPSAAVLGVDHAVLLGRATEYAVRGFAGPLSMKMVRRGAAVWRTGGVERTLTPGRILVVNRDEPYDLEIDSADPVETFCVFFRDGFVEDVARTLSTPEAALLDRPDAGSTTVFLSSIERRVGDLAPLLLAIERRAARAEEGDDLLARLAEWLVARDGETRLRALAAPAKRPVTRDEILRRVLRGRDRIESCWNERLPLQEIARTAGMAPHHFHRSFHRIFGRTPLEYLRDLRLEEARRLLRDTDFGLQDVCTAVGFESLPSFMHRFRRSAGTTPGRYRAEFRKIR